MGLTMTKYFVDINSNFMGSFLGAPKKVWVEELDPDGNVTGVYQTVPGEFDDPVVDPAWIEVPTPPIDARQTWNFTEDTWNNIPVTNKDINEERMRRIALGATIPVPGVTGGIPVTGTDEDTRNLQGLGFAASLRLGSGDTTTLTEFRDALNNMHYLVPGQVIVLWQNSAGYVSQVYAASWALKALDPIPTDYTNDSYWPTYS